jgi:hypothetical protein
MNRFALQWLVPARVDRFTHVMVLDRERPAPYLSDAGHGVDKARALLNLWETLVESGAAAETIDFVAVAYMRRTGTCPRNRGMARDLR